MKLGYVILYVGQVEPSMAFYEKAFGLKRGFLSEGKEYGEMITGETKLGFASHRVAETHGFEYDKMSLQKNPSSSEVGFTTQDVVGAYLKAVQSGATELSKPEKKPWGQTVAFVRDLNGFIVEISSPMGG